MAMEALKQFNWVDIFSIILFLRICYVATKTGLPVEIFKLLGTLLATYAALHYFTAVSDLFGGKVNIEKMSLEFRDFLAFLVLASAGYIFMVLVRMVFFQFIKIEAVSLLNKWGGFILGLGRGLLLTSIAVFGLTISTLPYLKTSVEKSYLGGRIFQVAPATYTSLWNNLGAKFLPKETFNKVVYEVEANVTRQ